MYVSNSKSKITQEFRNYLNQQIKEVVKDKIKIVEYTYCDDPDKAGITEYAKFTDKELNNYIAHYWHNDSFKQFKRV